MKSFGLALSFLLFAVTLQAAKPDDDSTTTKSSRYHKSVAVSALFGKGIQTHAFVKGDNPQQEPYENFLAFTGQSAKQSMVSR